MRQTKEQLIQENAELRDRLNNAGVEFRKLQKELEDETYARESYEKEFIKAKNQIHFLAWMLFEKWVSVENKLDGRIDVIVYPLDHNSDEF